MCFGSSYRHFGSVSSVLLILDPFSTHSATGTPVLKMLHLQLQVPHSPLARFQLCRNLSWRVVSPSLVTQLCRVQYLHMSSL